MLAIKTITDSRRCHFKVEARLNEQLCTEDYMNEIRGPVEMGIRDQQIEEGTKLADYKLLCKNLSKRSA